MEDISLGILQGMSASAQATLQSMRERLYASPSTNHSAEAMAKGYVEAALKDIEMARHWLDLIPARRNMEKSQ